MTKLTDTTNSIVLRFGLSVEVRRIQNKVDSATVKRRTQYTRDGQTYVSTITLETYSGRYAEESAIRFAQGWMAAMTAMRHVVVNDPWARDELLREQW